MTTKNTLIVVCGPTGIGKTEKAIALAQHFNTEIISCDSRQIYKELDIGVAKPSEEELNSVKHYFIDHISIQDYYNASIFEDEVLVLLDTLFENNNIVVMTGGTGMYIDAVCTGLDQTPRIDAEIRNNLKTRLEEEGIEKLRMELKILDPITYNKIDLQNHMRILKALEVTIMTGKPYSSLMGQERKKRNFNVVKVGLNAPREIMFDRINRRVDIMIEKELEAEAKSVYKYKDLNSLNTVGYKELFSYFDGTVTREKAIEQIKTNTRRYSKKQLTWLARYPEIKWFDISQDTHDIIDYCDNTLSENTKL